MAWIPDLLVIVAFAAIATVIALATTGSGPAGAIAASATGVTCLLWFAIQGLRDELRQDQ